MLDDHYRQTLTRHSDFPLTAIRQGEPRSTFPWEERLVCHSEQRL